MSQILRMLKRYRVTTDVRVTENYSNKTIHIVTNKMFSQQGLLLTMVSLLIVLLYLDSGS